MQKPMKHKGYLGSIEISFDDNCLHGQLLFINDKIVYEGQTPGELEQQFILAVDDYLEFCEEIDRLPQKPFSGAFNIRVPVELHEAAAKKAYTLNVSLNEFVKDAIKEKVWVAEHSTALHVHKHQHAYKSETVESQYSVTRIGEDMRWKTSSSQNVETLQ